MYTPTYLQSSAAMTRLVIGIIGKNGVGKTTFALTAPNRIWLDFDGKLPPGEQRIVPTAPAFVKQWAPTQPYIGKHLNVRDAFAKFCESELPKFAPQQTLILDSFTMMEKTLNIVAPDDMQFISKKTREFDGWDFYRHKARYLAMILFYFKDFTPANVIVNFHETHDWNPDGTMAATSKPLIEGKTADDVASYFRFFLRLTVKGGKRVFEPMSNSQTHPSIPIGVRVDDTTPVTFDALAKLVGLGSETQPQTKTT